MKRNRYRNYYSYAINVRARIIIIICEYTTKLKRVMYEIKKIIIEIVRFNGFILDKKIRHLCTNIKGKIKTQYYIV